MYCILTTVLKPNSQSVLVRILVNFEKQRPKTNRPTFLLMLHYHSPEGMNKIEE